MATVSAKDRSHEGIINDTLAQFLRERCSLSAVAETLHNGRCPDMIVRLSEGPVILAARPRNRVGDPLGVL